jgi:hypothetical protein
VLNKKTLELFQSSRFLMIKEAIELLKEEISYNKFLDMHFSDFKNYIKQQKSSWNLFSCYFILLQDWKVLFEYYKIDNCFPVMMEEAKIKEWQIEV